VFHSNVWAEATVELTQGVLLCPLRSRSVWRCWTRAWSLRSRSWSQRGSSSSWCSTSIGPRASSAPTAWKAPRATSGEPSCPTERRHSTNVF